jgi:hypothetical protein
MTASDVPLKNLRKLSERARPRLSDWTICDDAILKCTNSFDLNFDKISRLHEYRRLALEANTAGRARQNNVPRH